MLEPLAGPSDQLPLRPTQNPGPGRVDTDPDASAIGHAQHVLTDLPNAVPLGGPLLQPPLEKPFGILLVVNVCVGTIQRRIVPSRSRSATPLARCHRYSPS